MLRKAARLFRSLNFPCAATASTCEDSPCFQVFGVNLFHVIANSSQRFVSLKIWKIWGMHVDLHAQLCTVRGGGCVDHHGDHRFVLLHHSGDDLRYGFSQRCDEQMHLWFVFASWGHGMGSWSHRSHCIYLLHRSMPDFFCYIFVLCFQFKFLIDLSGSWYKAMLWTTPCTWSPWVHSWGSNATTFLCLANECLIFACHSLLSLSTIVQVLLLHECFDSHSTLLYLHYLCFVETAIPTLVTEDLQYMVADIGNLYFSRWEFWRTLHRRCAKVYKYGSNDALAEDDPIDLGQSWQGQHVIRNAWCERLRGKVLLQEPFKLWLCSLLWLCWPHGWKLSGQGKEKSSQRLQRMSFALKTMGGATVGSAITTAGLSWITRACNSG